MKKRFAFLFLIVASAFSLNAFAQKDSSGIYKTDADFKQGKLSFAINYKTETHKINDQVIFNATDVKVTHEGKTYTFKKSDLYGFRDTKGVDFRFIDNKSYKILNKGSDLILYTYNTPEEGVKKGATQYTMVYYFAKDINSAPLLLTKDNLKANYPTNHKFHDALDAIFKTDKELSEYDSFHKMYKVDHVLEMNSKT